MKNYLVTGGAGFIGSNIVDELVNRGDRVTILDNLSTGNRENVNSKAAFVNADIRELEEIAQTFKGVEGVFHLAAFPRVQTSIEDPGMTNGHNVTGTLNVLLAARDAGVRRVVYSASSAAYGDASSLPTREDSQISPMSPYGLQKYIGEEYCRLFSLLYGLQAVSLRYFNVYGSRMTDSGAYYTVIKAHLNQRAKNQPLLITGDGKQTRDFIHVRDVARANILAMESNNVGNGEVINIGSGKSHSINEIASYIGGRVKHIPSRIEPRDTLANITLAKKLLGWKPKEDLPRAIKELLT